MTSLSAQGRPVTKRAIRLASAAHGLQTGVDSQQACARHSSPLPATCDRSSSRSCLRASSLLDEAGFARAFETALPAAWACGLGAG